MRERHYNKLWFSNSKPEVGLLKAEIKQKTLEAELAVRNSEAASSESSIEVKKTTRRFQNEVAVGEAERGKVISNIIRVCFENWK